MLVIQNLYKIFLEKKLGYQVKVVSTGEEALDCVKQDKFDVMLLDLGLPGVSGEFVLAAIRVQEIETQKKHLPIIINTAHGSKMDLQACKKNGADEAFQKPLGFEHLKRTLEALTA